MNAARAFTVTLIVLSAMAFLNSFIHVPLAHETTSPTFGVVAGYYNPDELDTYFPDLWTLVKSIGATHVTGSSRRWAADQAAESGIKLLMTYTAPPTNPSTMEDYFKSEEAMKAHLDKYDIAQYKNHPGVFGHQLAAEPWNNYFFDPSNPDEATLSLIGVLHYGCDYIRSLDPTHPVLVTLDPAGTYYNDVAGIPETIIQKRIDWISRFIDFCDVLDYHYYVHEGAGEEWWRNPEGMRAAIVKQFDQVIIPSAKGKPIIIGETGCPSSTSLDWQGKLASFNEQQQADYFRIYGEETKKRNLLVFAFKLVDTRNYEPYYGLFNYTNNGIINNPKKIAHSIASYLTLTPNEIPEFPSWAIPPIFAIAAISIIVFRKKLGQ